MHITTSLGERRAELDKQGIIFHNIDFARSINPLAALKSLKQLTKLMKENNFFWYMYMPLWHLYWEDSCKINPYKTCIIYGSWILFL